MGAFYIMKDGYVVRHGCCDDGLEELHKFDGETVHLGEVPSDAEFVPPPPILYFEKRRLLYPSIEDFVDAYVKMNSGDKSIEDEGTSEMNTYITKCLHVKQQVPKSYREERKHSR